MKNKIFFLAVFICIACIQLNGADKNQYRVINIPPSLIVNADAVWRLNESTVEIKSHKKLIYTHKYAITLLNDNARHYCYENLFTDKFHELDDVDGAIYDNNGEKIRDLEKKDMYEDVMATYGVVSDTRIKRIALLHNRYPFTIELTFTYIYDGFLDWPAWYSHPSLDPIEQSKFSVTLPASDTLRYWCNIDTVKPEIKIDGSKKTYIWEEKNLKPIEKFAANSYYDIATIVDIAPSKFKFDEYEGNMSTWQNFGLWYNQLLTDKDILADSIKQTITSLVKTSDSDYEKVKKIYSYLQTKTRYVSIQLGIGGWQPLPASFVHEKGYGDCKALSNYMVAMLKVIGINAYPFLINSGRNHKYVFINEFPSNQFNHVMVCVPLQKDTIWLECTSQSIPFNTIDSYTENRGALLITPNGGVVIRTPQTNPLQNTQIRTANVNLSDLGSAESFSVVKRTGNQQLDMRKNVTDKNFEEKERWLMNDIGITNANLVTYKIDGLEEKASELILSVHLRLPKFASTTPDRIFFVPNLMERKTTVPVNVTKRLSPVYISYPYLDVDTITYKIPKDFVVEAMPNKVTIEKPYGFYKSECILKDSETIVYVRHREVNTYEISADCFAEYRKYMSDIVKADKAQVVLVKKK